MTVPPPPPPPTGPDPWPGTPEQPRKVPGDVITAFQLWLVVLGLGIVSLIAGLMWLFSDRDTFVDQLHDDLSSQSPELEATRAQVEQLFTISVVAAGVIVGIGFTALFVLFMFKMRAGRNWARILLTILGIFMAFSAVPTIFGLGAGTGWATPVLGGVGILQAVAAIGAIVLMHRRESNEYFLKLPTPR